MATFHERIKGLRVERDLTLRELGKILGKSEATMSLYESGEREPKKAADYVRIADFFGVTLDYLMGRTDHKSGLVIKEEINGDTYEFEVDRDVYPNGLSREELIEKLEILKKLEEAGFKYDPPKTV